MELQRIDPVAQLVIAGGSVSDAPGEHRFTVWEVPCPAGCGRLLWGWAHGHVAAHSTPYRCPCGASGTTDAAAVTNVRHCSVINRSDRTWA